LKKINGSGIQQSVIYKIYAHILMQLKLTRAILETGIAVKTVIGENVYALTAKKDGLKINELRRKSYH
jgi:hypothetical protein